MNSVKKMNQPIFIPQQNKTNNKLLHDYYQKSENKKDSLHKGDIISIVSMEIGESEGRSQSYSYQEEHKNSQNKIDSKKNLK